LFHGHPVLEYSSTVHLINSHSIAGGVPIVVVMVVSTLRHAITRDALGCMPRDICQVICLPSPKALSSHP